VLWRAAVPHYSLYLLAGLSSWIFFATTVQAGSRAMLDNAPLIRKTRFPRQLVAFSVVGTNLVTYVVMLAIILVLSFAFIPSARATEWLAIPLAALFVLFVAGLTLALACLDVLYRDIEHLIASLLLPWFFLTPVLWTSDQFAAHPTLQEILRWGNPVTPPIEAIRAPLYAGTLPHWTDVLYTVGVTAAALAFGAWVFGRVDDRIAVEL